MADLTYTMNINGAPALTTLNKVESNLSKLKTSFGGLQAVLAGLFTTAVIGNALKFADNINDISLATGVATQNILGLNAALLTNGGNSESAAKMLTKLSLSVEDANSGALKTSDAFSELGISLNDLKSLSDTDILNRTILGLSKISDASKRAALATSILGKGAKGVDFVGVGGDIGKATQEAAKYTASVEKAAAAQDKITQAINQFQLSLLKALDPLLTFVASLKPEQIEKFVDALVKIGGAAAAIATVATSLSYLGKLIIGIGLYWAGAMTKISSGAAAMKAGVGGLIDTVVIFFKVLKNYTIPAWLTSGVSIFTKLEGTIGMLVKRFGFLATSAGAAALGIGAFATGIGEAILVIAGVATAAYAVGEIIDAMFDTKIIQTFTEGLDVVWSKLKSIGASIGDAYGKIKGMMGFEAEPAKTGGRRAQTAEEIAGIKKFAEEQQKAGKAEREQIDTRAKALNEFKLQQQQVVDLYSNQNNSVLQQLTFEKSLVGKSAEEVEVLRAKEASLNNQRQIIADLVKEQTKLKQAMSVPGTSANELADLQNRYSTIGDTILKIQQETGIYQGQLQRNVEALQSAKLLDQDRLNTLERITQQMEKQQQIDAAMLQIRQSTDALLNQAKFEGAQMGRSPLEKQMAQIQEDAKKGALEAGRAFSAMFDNADMSAADAKKLADGLDLIAEKYKAIADVQTKNLEQSRSWAQGWKEASDKYLDSMTNAATKAGEMFNSITSNMNSAIDNFVDNGKMSFSDFAASVIKDLIKIELKASAAKIFSGAGGLFGGGGGGAAAGATAGGGDMLSSVWDWGKSLLGFANGGMPPVNKPSIVGENGAEIFVPRTAGTILPNGTGLNNGQSNAPVSNTYITNNIQAVDAKSVAQLFAENRKTLFGTVEMARKEMSYGR